jgi:hypothetical protein
VYRLTFGVKYSQSVLTSLEHTKTELFIFLWNEQKSRFEILTLTQQWPVHNDVKGPRCFLIGPTLIFSAPVVLWLAFLSPRDSYTYFHFWPCEARKTFVARDPSIQPPRSSVVRLSMTKNLVQTTPTLSLSVLKYGTWVAMDAYHVGNTANTAVFPTWFQ